MRNISWAFILVVMGLPLSACDSAGPEENEAPSVAFSFSPENPKIGDTVNFTADARDPDGRIDMYTWDLNGDDVPDASGTSATFTYEEEGGHTVSLTVTDDRGASETATEIITVNLPPNTKPSVDFSFSPQNPRAGETVNFTANADDSDGTIEKYSWDFDGDGSQDASGASPSYAFESMGEFVASLTVTDDRGGSETASHSISVRQRYTQVTITEVTVQEMPFTTDEGEGWDTSTGPDVYFAALDGSDQQVAASSVINDVGPSSLPISFENGSFTITDLSETHSIALVDYDDFTADEFIGGISYSYDGLVGDYPETFTLDAGAGIVLEVALEWQE